VSDGNGTSGGSMRRRFRVRGLLLRPWEPRFGEPSDPAPALLGANVVRVLCSRVDPAAALVELADRRFALTGTVLIAGPAGMLLEHLGHRHAQASEAERPWLAQCIERLGRERWPDRTTAWPA
jgi:hypothetical protein